MLAIKVIRMEPEQATENTLGGSGSGFLANRRHFRVEILASGIGQQAEALHSGATGGAVLVERPRIVHGLVTCTVHGLLGRREVREAMSTRRGGVPPASEGCEGNVDSSGTVTSTPRRDRLAA